MTDCDAATIAAAIAESRLRDTIVELCADVDDVIYYLAETEYEYDYTIVEDYVDLWGWLDSTEPHSQEFRLHLVRP